MIKHFGKKVHIWPRNRHDSINENEIAGNSNRQKEWQTPELEPQQEKFRSRSKSLDVNISRKVLDDCESTYKIYNRILKEGNFSLLTLLALAAAINSVFLFYWLTHCK